MNTLPIYNDHAPCSCTNHKYNNIYLPFIFGYDFETDSETNRETRDRLRDAYAAINKILRDVLKIPESNIKQSKHKHKIKIHTIEEIYFNISFYRLYIGKELPAGPWMSSEKKIGIVEELSAHIITTEPEGRTDLDYMIMIQIPRMGGDMFAFRKIFELIESTIYEKKEIPDLIDNV